MSTSALQTLPLYTVDDTDAITEYFEIFKVILVMLNFIVVAGSKYSILKV